jgi:hypothetical protein
MMPENSNIASIQEINADKMDVAFMPHHSCNCIKKFKDGSTGLPNFGPAELCSWPG